MKFLGNDCNLTDRVSHYIGIQGLAV